jgi:hypothetical protein
MRSALTATLNGLARFHTILKISLVRSQLHQSEGVRLYPWRLLLLDEINYETSSAAYLPVLYYTLFLLHDIASPIVKCYANLICHQFLQIGNPECQNYAKRRNGNSSEEYSIESLRVCDLICCSTSSYDGRCKL